MFKRDGLKGGHVIALGEGNEEAMMSAIKAYPGTCTPMNRCGGPAYCTSSAPTSAPHRRKQTAQVTMSACCECRRVANRRGREPLQRDEVARCWRVARHRHLVRLR
eukprot:3457774-Rhodomonas_salina.1